jgi:hypothetical protein
MASREAVARALVALRVQYKTLDDSPAMLDQIRMGVEDYNDEELRIAVDRIVVSHGKFAPRISEIREYCAAVAKTRRWVATATQREDRSTAYCTLCGSRTLVASQPWPNGQSRDVPLHEPDCARAGAEDQPASAVRMETWPSRKPRRMAEKPSGPVALGAVIAIPGPEMARQATIPPPLVSSDVSALPEAHRGA